MWLCCLPAMHARHPITAPPRLALRLDTHATLQSGGCHIQGFDLTTEELLTYISESSTMSKSIEEYEGTLQ